MSFSIRSGANHVHERAMALVERDEQTRRQAERVAVGRWLRTAVTAGNASLGNGGSASARRAV
jgi:hypothetical protein